MCEHHDLVQTTGGLQYEAAIRHGYVLHYVAFCSTRALENIRKRHWAGRALIMDGSRFAARRNCATALGRSLTGNSHQVSHDGVSGSARNVGTCRQRSNVQLIP